MRVSRHGEGIIDLKRFLNAWDTVIAGMKKPPEEKVLKDILLRQVRSCHLLRYDIDTCKPRKVSRLRSIRSDSRRVRARSASRETPSATQWDTQLPPPIRSGAHGVAAAETVDLAVALSAPVTGFACTLCYPDRASLCCVTVWLLYERPL